MAALQPQSDMPQKDFGEKKMFLMGRAESSAPGHPLYVEAVVRGENNTHSWTVANGLT